ncbi:hypothetical protein [Microbacterium sp.]|uniref:hypothetical protein n=1 Tax=Microbacterium sp. TaxID=51671 RepID=UPI0028113671|nr:hypothetical protein [Microbacterium sp.]
MSAHDVEQCIKDYLRAHGGSASAGDVTAHAVGEGYAASTVRRVADRTVVKTREGNTFTWSLRPQPTFTASPAEEEPMPSRAGRLVEVKAKPSLWDAMKFNGQPMSHDPGARYATPGARPIDDRRRERLAEPEAEPPAPAWDSRYASMSQSERMHLIGQRPTVSSYIEFWEGYYEPTEVETICILEADDDGAYPLTDTAGGNAMVPLPY